MTQPNLANPTTPSDTKTFEKKPITDDFVPRTDSPNDSGDILPKSDFIKPAPGEPGSLQPLQPLQNGTEDILPNFNPGTTNPNPNPGENAPAFNRENFDALKPSADVMPLDIKSTVVGTVSPDRRRIIMNTGFRIPSVARVQVKPAPASIVSDTKIAAK